MARKPRSLGRVVCVIKLPDENRIEFYNARSCTNTHLLPSYPELAVFPAHKFLINAHNYTRI